MNKSLLLLLCLLASVGTLRAQDPVFTQYFTQKLYLNPAFAGYEPGTVVNSGFRNQWRSVASREARYLTNHVELSQEMPGLTSSKGSGMGLGLSYTDNAEGEGAYRATTANVGLLRWQRASLSIAWHNWACNIDQSKVGLSLGFSGSYNRYVMDWQRFVFGDQLDPIYGVVRGTNVPLPDGGISGTSFFDASAGFVTHYRPSLHQTFRLGMAVHHIILQNNSGNGFDERLPMRISLHASGILHDAGKGQIKTQWQFNPLVRAEFQRASAAVADTSAGRPGPFWHALFAAGCVAKSPGLTRVAGGLWYQGNAPLAVAPAYRGGIHALVFYGGLEQLTESSSGDAGFFYELGFSWEHNFGGARSLGDLFELTLSVGIPNSNLFGFGCSSCMLRHVLNRF